MKRTLQILFLLAFPFNYLTAQFFETGQSPFSIKWKELNTGNHRIIFPETYQNQAFRIAGLLGEAYSLSGHTLSHSPGKIPVIIHSHNARPNGLVAWAPKRMELYPTSSGFVRGGNRLAQLAVHEQRHVVQIDRLNRGVTGLLYYLLGEQAVGFAAGRLPLWFLEGDAVVTETVLTASGRGRDPSFQMPLKALLLSDKGLYSYDKYLSGSYRDYVPDHYIYGYHLVSALRKEYGFEIWENVIDNVGRRPLHPAPFGSSLNMQTGSWLSSIHNDVMGYLTREWASQQQMRDIPELSRINRREERLYHSYRYPSWLGDSAVIAVKSGIGQTEEFVMLDMDGNETSLFYSGRLSSSSITVSRGRIIWSEYQSDPRWGLRQYSVLKLFDLKTMRERQISSRSRYFSPVFAPDGLFIAVVGVDNEDRNFIHLMNSVTGEIYRTFPAPDGMTLYRPAFHPEGGIVYASAESALGMSIISLNTESGSWEKITDPAFANLRGIFRCGNYLCYNSDIAGVDELYALDLKSGDSFRLTESEYGAFDGDLSGSGNMLSWADYTASGYDLGVAPFRVEDRVENQDRPDGWTEILAGHEKGVVTGAFSDTTEWTTGPYRKGLNIMNLHSWAPFYFDYREFNIKELRIYPGVTLLSQNLLNTATTFMGYSYREGRHVIHGNIEYKGFYPVFEAGFDYGDSPVVFTGRDTIGPADISSSRQLNLRSNVYIPLNFSSGAYIAGIEPRAGIRYSNSLYHNDGADGYEKGMTITEARLLAFRYRRRSLRDLAPRWGQVFRWQMRTAPFESENLGSINAFEFTLYTPGLFSHHSLKLSAAIQRQDPVKYFYSSLVNFPRGYENGISEHLNLLQTGYSFPLAYPEIAFSWFIYITRMHAEVFADFGHNRYREINPDTGNLIWRNENLLSYGANTTFNYHLLRMVFPINTTVGFAWVPERGKASLLLSFGINLNI